MSDTGTAMNLDRLAIRIFLAIRGAGGRPRGRNIGSAAIMGSRNTVVNRRPAIARPVSLTRSLRDPMTCDPVTRIG